MPFSMKVGEIVGAIPISVKKKCLEMHEQGLSTKEIYTQYYSQLHDTQYSGFKTMFFKWKRKAQTDEKYLEGGNLGYAYTPTRTTVQVDKNGEVVQAWIKSHTSHDNVYLELIDEIKKIEPFKPIERVTTEYKERMLEIKLDDLHFGVAFFDDYEKTLQNILEVIESKIYEEINIVIGEDLLHTNDFRGHTNKGTFVGEIDAPRAYNDALRFYGLMTDKALKHSQNTNIVYSMGNHSESLSWTIIQVLKALYPQVNYDDELIERKAILYREIFIGISHCEETTSDLKVIKDIFMQEFLQEYAKAKTREIHLGHKHKQKEIEDVNGCTVRRLPSGVPTDKYTYRHGWTGTVKRFMLFEYTPTEIKHVHYV